MMAKEHFKFDFTPEMLQACIPTNKEVDEWYDAMVEILPLWDINTAERVAGWVAQCGHESGDFRLLQENLNYSKEALERVFPRYFGPGKRDAAEYARNPEKIANYVYMDEFRSRAGQMGNTQPGDGWRFRGRGLKQLTGRNNYEAFAKDMEMTAEEAAEYLETKKGAIDSACWFWDNANCNDFADRGDIVGMSKRINGGTIGLEDRQMRWERALRVFGGDVPAARTDDDAPVRRETLRKGSKGPLVKKLQEALGIGADGDFGPGTERALKQWQADNGLTADGIAGPATQARLFG
jgi:putative chitinase